MGWLEFFKYLTMGCIGGILIAFTVALTIIIVKSAMDL